MENAERALQHVAVLDKKRKPTGEYRYDGNVANRALELLGKQQGMFIDRHEGGHGKECAVVFVRR
jgi:phage terminase small subunit